MRAFICINSYPHFSYQAYQNVKNVARGKSKGIPIVSKPLKKPQKQIQAKNEVREQVPSTLAETAPSVSSTKDKESDTPIDDVVMVSPADVPLPDR